MTPAEFHAHTYHRAAPVRTPIVGPVPVRPYLGPRPSLLRDVAWMSCGMVVATAVVAALWILAGTLPR